MTREETPMQVCKRTGQPYVKLVIDEKPIKDRTKYGSRGGRLEVEGPVSKRLLDAALALWREIANDDE